MNIPAAMQIESAKDMPFDDKTSAHLLKELETAGTGAGESFLFCRGYLLGLATARVMIAQGAWTQQNILDDWQKAATAQAEPEPVAAEVIENPTPQQLTEAAQEMNASLTIPRPKEN